MSMAQGSISVEPMGDRAIEQRPSAGAVRLARERWREALLVVGPWLLLILAHSALALSRDRPLIFADEAGYLGNARYLAGGLPIKLFKSGAYYPGYSLLIAPVFWLGLSPAQTYQVILLFNGLLLSSVYISLVHWFRRILGDGSLYAYAISFVVSAYPTFLIQPLFAMSESAIIALSCVLPLCVHALLKNKRATTALLLGALVALLHLVHPRYAGTVALTALGLGGLSAARVLSWKVALAGASTLGAGVLGGRWLTRHVTEANLGNAVSEGSRLNLLGSLEGIGALLLEISGQLWYLASASAGVAVLGVVALARLALQVPGGTPRRQSPAWNAVVFMLASAVLAFGISSLFMATGKRVDHFIYGRYNEGLVAPFLATGLWSLIHAGRSWRAEIGRLVLVAVTTVLFALILVWARGEALLASPNYANILALVASMKLFSGTRLIGVGAFALGAFVVVAIARRVRAWIALLLLAALFGWATYHAHRVFLAMQKGRAARQVLFDRVAAMPDIAGISYDASHFDPVTLFFGQYFLPDARFDVFDGSKGQLPKTSFVLSRDKWPERSGQPAKLIGKDSSGWALWEMEDCCSTTHLSAQNCGGTRVDGIKDKGFHETESWPAGQVRWTNGHASLLIPVAKGELAASNLFLDVVSVGPQANRVAIVANGHQIFSGKLPRGRSRLVLPLANVPSANNLDLRIDSKTFIPAEAGDSTDKRELGIAIRSLRLVRECCLARGLPLFPDTPPAAADADAPNVPAE